MTICIAAICNYKEGMISPCIVFCADRLISSGMGISFEHGNPKIKLIENRAIIMEAGDGTVSDLILDKEVLFIGSEVDVKRIADLINEKITNFKHNQINRLLSPFGLNQNSFIEKARELPEKVCNQIINDIKNLDLDLQFIVAGLDRDGNPQLFTISDQYGIKCYNSLGFVAIGSGLPLSLLQITKTIHSNRINLSEAITKVYSAKINAERISGVGRMTDLGVLQLSGENNNFSASLVEVSQEYKDKINEELKKIPKSESEVHLEVQKMLDEVLYVPPQTQAEKF